MDRSASNEPQRAVRQHPPARWSSALQRRVPGDVEIGNALNPATTFPENALSMIPNHARQMGRALRMARGGDPEVALCGWIAAQRLRALLERTTA